MTGLATHLVPYKKNSPARRLVADTERGRLYAIEIHKSSFIKRLPGEHCPGDCLSLLGQSRVPLDPVRCAMLNFLLQPIVRTLTGGSWSLPRRGDGRLY